MRKEGGFLPMLAGLAMRALLLAKSVLPALGVCALSGSGSEVVVSDICLKCIVCCVNAHSKDLNLTPGQLPSTYGLCT